MARYMMTVDSSHEEVPEQESAKVSRLPQSRTASLPPRDLLLLGWIVLMSVGQITVFTYPYWTSRALLLLLVLPLGLWYWFCLVWARDPAARALLLVVGALAVSAAVSMAPRNSLIGFGGSSQSVVFFVALGCVWAVGRYATPTVRDLAGPVLLATLVIHLAFGLCQILLQIDTGPLATFDGRAAGLASNAVYFGALMTIGVVLVGRYVLRESRRSWVVVLVIMSFGLSLSGSRVALAAALLVLVGSAIGKEPRRAAVVFGSLIGGLVLAELFSWAVYVENSFDRTVRIGADGRTEVWKYGWQAFLERPVLGWGPDLFRTAIEARLSDEFVRTYDVPGVQPWSDPHNVVVGLATGSGLMGIAAFAFFLFVVIRRTRGDLAACGLAISLTWLFQPLVIVTAPIAALLLGLSATRIEGDGSPRDRSRIAHGLLATGLIAASVVAFIDLRIQAADSVTEEAESWNWYWRDPRVANRISDRFAAATLSGDADYAAQALEWAGRATRYQPERAIWWAELAHLQLVFGDRDGAEDSARAALERQPNEPQAWLVLRAVATTDDEAATAAQRVCELVPEQC